MNDDPAVKFKKVLEAAQKNRASHQKCLHILDGIYKKMGCNKFKQIFLRYLTSIFATESFAAKNDNVERLLEFLAHFVVHTIPTEDNETIPDDPFENVPTHPFFTEIVMETLKFHCLTNASVRYNSCLYLRLLLQNISSNVNVDYDICERIMEAMLERTTDIKPSVRLQAVMALVKLQDPSDPDCPVIKAYLGLLLDGNPLVRREVVKRIAAYIGSAPYIMRHLRDVDANVRLQAFKRCADMGPKLFKIYERQDILMSGLNETHESVRRSFQEDLLIKWLNAYEGDFIKLLNSIKIDAEETDMLKTQHISESIMDIYFKIRPIRDIISSLPLNEEKLIPQEKMVAEVILLWKFLVQHLRKCSGELNMDVEEILPELTPFCEYIRSTVNTAKGKNMEDWEYLEYQHILHSLFQIAEDEKNHLRIKRKLLKIANELYPKSEDITTTICCLISDIREPLVDVEEEILPPASTKYDNHDFRVATLKVKLNTLEDAMEEAADRRDFLKAEQLKAEAQKIQEEIALLVESRAVPQYKVVKTIKDDPKTVSHCLDLLIALLELPNVRRISTALETVKNEFLLPLLESSVADINWRVLHCLALFACMSIELAEEYLKVLCIPLMTCRAIPNYNKCALKVSIKAVADLYHLYGAQIFGGFNDISNAAQNSSTNHTRRLYDDGLEESIVDPNKFQFENVIDILMDLVDEEDVEIHEYATKALHRLILNNFPVSPPFIIRIILKWYNPATAKSPNQVQQALGVLIVMYASKVKGAKETIAKAVLPILRNVACVPKADPLSEIDTDNLLNYLAVITSSDDETGATDLHIKLTRLILTEVGKGRNLVLLGYLTKLLTFLNIPVGDIEVVANIIEHARRLMSDESLPLEKTSRKCIEKFVQKIKHSVEQKNKAEECEDDRTTDTESIPTDKENNSQGDSTVSNIQKITENNAPIVAGDSLTKNTKKESNENSDDITTRSLKRRNNGTQPNNLKEVTESSEDIRTPPEKRRRNGASEISRQNNAKEVSKINSNTVEDIRTPLRESKRVRTPNKKYGEYFKHAVRTGKNGANRSRENASVDSSNNSEGEGPKARGADTGSQGNGSKKQTSSDLDLSSSSRRATRLSKNIYDKQPNKNNKDGNNRDVRMNEKSSKDTEKDVLKGPETRDFGIQRRAASNRRRASSDLDLSSPTRRVMRLSRNGYDKQPNKNNKDSKIRDVGTIDKGSKDNERGVSMKGPRDVDIESRGGSSKRQTSSDLDLSSPTRRDTRLSRNRYDKQPKKNNKHSKNRDVGTNQKGSKDNQKRVSMKGPETRVVYIRRRGVSSKRQTSSDLDLSSPTRRDTRLSRNGYDKQPDKNNKDSKNRDERTNEKGTQDNEKGVLMKGGALHQNPKKQTSDRRMKKRVRVLSSENLSSNSEKNYSRHVSTDSGILRQSSKRPKLVVDAKKQITRSTRLGSVKNVILSEHSDSSYTKNGSFRPIAESTTCTSPVNSGKINHLDFWSLLLWIF
nr:unnamed protein product [Callosobruchus analis]